MFTFQKALTDKTAVILFGLYSNLLTWAAQLLFLSLDKDEKLSTRSLGTLVQATASQPEFPLPLISLMSISVWSNLENGRYRNGMGVTNQDEIWEMTSI